MIKVGISQCLLGSKVRFDGGHRQNRFCKDELSQVFKFVPLCPEVGIGMPIPRKTIRLIGDTDAPRAVYSDNTGEDFTDALQVYAKDHTEQLSQMSGYVFCKASPSCGLERVKVYKDNGYADKTGTGIFAAKVREMYPLMPLEEDGRLNDPLLKDSFIKRVFIYNEWQQLLQKGLTPNRLFKFHARHKLTLLAHCQPTYRQLGPLLSGVTDGDVEVVASRYIERLMKALKNTANRKNNTNVLMHLQGFLKDKLSNGDRAELASCIMDYHNGTQTILSVITLFKHHLRRHPVPYVEQQSYINPYPQKLAIQVYMH